MTFNSSCAYAAVSNLAYFADVLDRDIIKIAKIDKYFVYDSKANRYMAGSQLQSKQWFDLFLNKYGYELVEEKLTKSSVPSFLAQATTQVMLGLCNEQGKHTAIFNKECDRGFEFINMKHESSAEDDYIYLSRQELIERLDEATSIAYVQKLPQGKGASALPVNDITHFDKYSAELLSYCKEPRARIEILQLSDRLFAPLLLHIRAVMQIMLQTKILDNIERLLEGFVGKLRSETNVIENILDIPLLQRTLDEYRAYLLQ